MRITFKNISLAIATGFTAATAYHKYSLHTQTSLQQTVQSEVKFKSRQNHLDEIEANNKYDLVVIGGGCNGAGVLLDASTRGLRALLLQKEDFSSGTSSKSTKLIHGGVRYLEQVFELRWASVSSRIEKYKLVKEAIIERGYMLDSAPHITQKIPFVIPCTNLFRTIYYYIGSVVYYAIYWWHAPAGTRKFKFPTFMHRQEIDQFFPYLSDKYTNGVVYEDGSFNDSRMVLAALLTATLGNGLTMPETFKPANMLNKAEFKSFIKNEQGQITGVIFEDLLTGIEKQVECKFAVNCAGAWGDNVRLLDDPGAQKRLCLVGGSHITYKSEISSKKYGICMPSKDGRITLVVPWLHRVIVGTTEKKYQTPENNPICSDEQRIFIYETMLNSFDKMSTEQLFSFEISKWCGLRPLVLGEGNSATKDMPRTHVIERSGSGLYSLMGGKWTIYRKMGEDLVDLISKELQATGEKYPQSQTKRLKLIGSCSQLICGKLVANHGELGNHLYNNYGKFAEEIVKGDLTPVAGLVTRAEIKWIVDNEMPTSIEDILLRRTRLAFLLGKKSIMAIVPEIGQILHSGKNSHEREEEIKRSMEAICRMQFD